MIKSKFLVNSNTDCKELWYNKFIATTKEYIEFVCKQINGDYSMRYKKMFGEYMVYANDKPIFLVCDNTV